MKILLAGGAVRNLLLGRPATDKDFLVLETDAAGFRARFPEARLVGKSFPVFLVHGNEFALPRAPGGIDADLAARDLTINAMALDADGALFAHPSALEDLENRMLRPASPTSLADDPLRVFRAARFAAQLSDFSAHPELVGAMRETAGSGLLDGLAEHRVGREVQKALSAERPGQFIRLLAQAECLRPWLAELHGADAIPAGPAPHHRESVLEHSAALMDELAGDDCACWMALCHDLGKTATDPAKWPRHHGHDKAGAPMAQALGQRLALPNRLIDAGRMAARWHMTAARYPELRPTTRVDLLMRLHLARLLEPLFALVRADHGQDHLSKAEAELKAVLSVRLPTTKRDMGPQSGALLRQMRAHALAERSHK